MTALLSVTAVVLAACGGGVDQGAQVRATVVEYGKAVAAKDYGKICRLFAPNLIQQMQSINLPCRTALSRSNLGAVIQPTLTVKSVKVTGQSALVGVHTDAANQNPVDTTLGLVQVGKAWRIASLAGSPTASK